MGSVLSLCAERGCITRADEFGAGKGILNVLILRPVFILLYRIL